MREATAQVPHERLRKLNQSFGDTTFVHQLAREHEKRDRHQRKAVHAVVDISIQQSELLGWIRRSGVQVR